MVDFFREHVTRSRIIPINSKYIIIALRKSDLILLLLFKIFAGVAIYQTNL